MAYSQNPQQHSGCERPLRPAFSAQHSPLTLTPLLLLLLCLTHLSAADFPLRWRWSNPSPHGNNVVDMALSQNQTLAVQVAEQGQIYTSDDFKLWIPRQSNTLLALRAVTFFNNRILITGEAGHVLYADSVQDFKEGNLTSGPTPDWLESVAASSSLAVAVGDNSAVYTSNNGQSWTRQSVSTTEWLRSVSHGNNTFVAVGELGRIITSPNGTNWTPRASNTFNDLNRVRFVNNQFIALGDDGLMLTSSNGLTWSPEITGALNRLHDATANNNSRLAIGENEVRLNPGLVWEDQIGGANSPDNWTYYSTLSLPNYHFIAGRTGMMAEAVKTNGTPYQWRPITPSPRHWLFDMTYASNLFVTVGDQATVMTSANGIDWNLELIPGAVTNTTFLGVGGTTNLLIAVGDSGSVILSPNIITNVSVTNIVGTNIVITEETISTLGLEWYPIPPPTTVDLQGVCFFNDLYILTGNSGILLTSPNGTDWTTRITPTLKYLSSITASPSLVIATGDDGTILSSRDGISWTSNPSGTTQWLYRVRYLNGQFFALGESGTLLVSNNGTQWSPRSTSTGSWLNDITYIDDSYFVVGNQGTVLTSPDTLTWTSRDTITRKSLFSAATDGIQLVTSGFEGVILRSPIVPDTTPIEFLAFSRFLSADRHFINNLYLFAGVPDQQFSLDYLTDFQTNNWTTGPTLEFFDSSGSFFYLEQIALTNAPALEFYRGTLPK